MKLRLFKTLLFGRTCLPNVLPADKHELEELHCNNLIAFTYSQEENNHMDIMDIMQFA